MDTTKKPERVKWVIGSQPDLVTDEKYIICQAMGGPFARQIVHEHNTWGELVEACKDLIALYSHVAPYGQSPVVGAAKAAIAAAEKEEG